MSIVDYQRNFALTFDQFIAHHNIQSNQVHKNVRYEKIKNATRVDLANAQHFFFYEGQLKMVYISDEVLAKNVWHEFKSTASVDKHETIRSRAGKTSNQLVFAEQGITVSINKTDVDFIEIYPPCTLQAYFDNIYREVGPFIR